jgi:transcriptional regulator with XRE-family HTH domain
MTEIELRKYVCGKLREHREAKQIQIKEVSKALKIGNGHISQTELGYNMPSIESLKKYCDFYNIKSSDVLPF